MIRRKEEHYIVGVEEGETLKEKFCYLVLLAVINLTFLMMYVLFLINYILEYYITGVAIFYLYPMF
jgi:hypothetical protein